MNNLRLSNSFIKWFVLLFASYFCSCSDRNVHSAGHEDSTHSVSFKIDSKSGPFPGTAVSIDQGEYLQKFNDKMKQLQKLADCPELNISFGGIYLSTVDSNGFHSEYEIIYTKYDGVIFRLEKEVCFKNDDLEYYLVSLLGKKSRDEL